MQSAGLCSAGGFNRFLSWNLSHMCRPAEEWQELQVEVDQLSSARVEARDVHSSGGRNNSEAS